MDYLSSNKIAVIDLGSAEVVEEELDDGTGQRKDRRGGYYLLFISPT